MRCRRCKPVHPVPAGDRCCNPQHVPRRFVPQFVECLSGIRSPPTAAKKHPRARRGCEPQPQSHAALSTGPTAPSAPQWRGHRWSRWPQAELAPDRWPSQRPPLGNHVARRHHNPPAIWKGQNGTRRLFIEVCEPVESASRPSQRGGRDGLRARLHHGLRLRRRLDAVDAPMRPA